MQIREITSPLIPSQLEQFRTLMEVLDAKIPFRTENLQDILASENSHLFVLEDDGMIIGCYTLGIFCSPTGRKASIEDVVVLPAYQGRHLGKMMLEDALTRLRSFTPIHVQLTSRPARVAANGLYRTIGFQNKETNVYVLDV